MQQEGGMGGWCAGPWRCMEEGKGRHALHLDSGPGVAPLLHPQWKYYLIIKRNEVMMHAAT